MTDSKVYGKTVDKWGLGLVTLCVHESREFIFWKLDLAIDRGTVNYK